MHPLKTAMFSTLLAVCCVLSTAALARECTCEDLPSLRSRAEAAGRAEAAWKQIFGWAKGLRRNPPLPTTNKELNLRFVELMGAPSSGWDTIMSQSVGEGEEPKKIGGMNEKGEPVVDEGFRSGHCDDIVAGVRLHEATHKNFFLAISLSRFVSILMPSNLLWLRAESEVEAYRAEKEFLQSKAAELAKKCKKGYRASGKTADLVYSGVICDLEQPFTVSGSIIDYKFQFTPASPTAGAVSITAAGMSVTAAGGGSYQIEGAETDKPRIAVTAGVVGHSPVGSKKGSGTVYIDLTPLETNECANNQ